MKHEPDIVRQLREDERIGLLNIEKKRTYVNDSRSLSTSVVSNSYTQDMYGQQEQSSIHQKKIDIGSIEEKYKILFDNFIVAVTLVDQNERIISWNSYAEELLGMNEKDLFMCPVKNLYPEEEWKKIRSENIRQKGIKYRMETQIIKKDNTIIDVELSVCVLHGAEGKTVGSVGIIKDITQLKKTEKELRESEEKYRTIFENSAVAITLTDAQERIISWNKYTEYLLNMDKEDLFMKPVSSLYPPEEWQKIRSQNIRQKGMQHHLETKIIRKDNQIFDVALSLSVLKNHQGEIIGSIGVLKDITVQKRMKEALELSEKRFKNLYEKAPVPYHTLSPEGIITDVNEKWCQILGYSKEEVVGKSIFDFIDKTEQESARNSFAQKIYSKKPYAGGNERKYLSKDGREHIFVIHDFLQFDNDFNIKSISTIMEDVTERKKVEQELLIKERAVNSSLSGIAISDASGKLRYVNPSLLAMWGYTSPDEVLGKNTFDLLHSNDHTRSAVQTLKETGRWFGEMAAIKKDGSIFTVQVSANLVSDAAGKILGIMASFVDVTEQKRSQAILRESEEKYHAIFDLSPQAIIILDYTGCIVDCNNKITSWLGYTKKEVIGKIVFELPFLTENSKMLARKNFLQRIQGVDVPPYELDFLTKAGERRIGMIYASPLRDKNNKITGDLVVVNDITQRMQVWEELVKSEEKYRVLAETSADGVFTTDTYGRLTYVNPSLEKLMGRRKSKILATPFRNYLSESSVYLFQQVMLDVRKKDCKIENVQLGLQHEDGYEVPIEVNIAPLKKDGKFIGIECTVRDITERERVVRELKKSENLRTEFMNIAAHELKSPVTPIKGYLELIASDREVNDRIKNWARISLRNTERLLHLINDILDVSRLETDTMRFNMERVNIVEILQDAAEDILPAVHNKNLKFHKEFPEQLPEVLGDKCRLSQVLKNLLVNAVKFTDYGSITLRAEEKENYIFIYVEDTGIGISNNELQKIFQKLYQAYTGEDRKNEGMGLGLFICKEIVKKHRGEIWAESEVGKGSRFIIKLPI
ncbi:MAG: PAS domain-containing sensor histidine kinase [Candidatus Thermoplasmatota archaeon]